MFGVRTARLVGALGFAFVAASADAAVFINEIHYDNGGTDSGEAIEVVATAGENLADYDIELYNGSNGTRYDTDPVPTGSSVSCGATVRLAVISYATNGIQNGNPDALALVGPGGVVQFLSYGGTFAATDGSAMGLTSVDIGQAEGSSTTATQSLQLSGNGTAYADFAWQAPATGTFGTCNTGQTFGTPVDLEPDLATSTPADGAIDVARDASIALSFTEPVDTTDEWFLLECSTSGARMVADANVTGSDASRTIDPLTDFAFEETCTLTIEAGFVLDRDGNADPMPANRTVRFTIAAAPVDVAPEVESVVPADGATNVATNATLTVKFNEPVTTSAAAFALDCAGSGPHAFAFAGGPSTYTLDPDADFDEVETCTLSIDADQVVDQDGTIDAMVADFLASFTTRAGAGTYYDSVDASSCVALRTSLHELIDDHTAFPYTHSTLDDTWTVLELADQDPLDATNVLEVYENVSYDKAGGGNSFYNREHTWPNSYGFNNLSGSNASGVPVSSAYTDTHMLWLSDIEYNSDRGSKPYADCPQASGCSARATQTYNGVGGGAIVYPGNHNWVLSSGSGEAFGSFEVWNHRKGEMARAILYMDVRYEGGTATGGNTVGQAEPDLVVTDDRNLIDSRRSTTSGTSYMGLKSTLMTWHANDAPDAQESLRNDVVFSFQGNRNPFVDHPEWVAIAFAEPCTGTAPSNQAPTLADAAVTVLENAANGTTVATLAATDPDAGQTLAYSIVGAAGPFAVAASTGAVTVTDSAAIDAAVAASYVLTVRATDDGTPALSDDATLTITVTPVNDAPSFTGGGDRTVLEDAGAQSYAGWASAISPGPSDESAQLVSFEVTSNTNADLFVAQPAVASDGTLSFTAVANASGIATIGVRARDTGGVASGGVDASGVQTFTVTVDAVNDAPVAADASGSVAAGSDAGTPVATVTATDVDGPSTAFAITGGNTGGAFAIDPASGAITVANPAAVQAASSPFALAVTVSDGGAPVATDTATVTITVTARGDALYADGFE